MTILAGDIGGTKTILALYEADAVKPSLIAEERFASPDHASLEALVSAFLDGREADISAACFGIPGPVIEEKAKTTNLPWTVSRDSLAGLLGTDDVHLVNDLEATGYGLAALGRDELLTLHEGDGEPEGSIALIAAGTGLGQAALIKDKAGYRPVASEGGHADFAPRGELEIELLRYLLTKHRRVSYERVLSGPGLVNVYQFLKASGYAREPAWLAQALAASEDEAKTITQTALEKNEPLCVKTLDVFAGVYGAQSGNLVLTFNATGGVYLGGGIAPKISAKLADGTFLKAFTEKGRLSPLVAATPVHVIMNQKTALLGAARYALHMALR